MKRHFTALCRHALGLPLPARAASRRFRAGALAAGLMATLAFYTRLNHLIMALGVAALALPLDVPVQAALRPSTWRSRVSWRPVLIVPATIALGVLLFMWRTWHYTGVFSLFYGTQRELAAVWQPGAALGTVLHRLAHSVMMVLTVNDPPRFDLYALPVLGGAAAATLGIAGVPRMRTLPLAAVLFFFAAIAGAFVAYGSAYSGRFSVHIMPITCALAVCGVASLFRRDHTSAP